MGGFQGGFPPVQNGDFNGGTPMDLMGFNEIEWDFHDDFNGIYEISWDFMALNGDLVGI